MNDRSLSIAVLGATGAVGGEILRALEASEMNVGRLLPVASVSTQINEVEFSGEMQSVRFPDDPELANADLAFCALPLKSAAEVTAPLIEAGVRVVDLSGAYAAEAPPSAVGLEVSSLELAHNVVSSPGAVGLALAHIGSAVGSLGELVSMRATVLSPTSIAGRLGMEELSGQVVALFNSQEPPRVAFPEGMAFDLLPSWGTSDDEGWSTAERLGGFQATELLGLDAAAVALTICVVPTFAGLSFSVACRVEGGGAADLIEVLAQRPLFEVARRSVELQPMGRLGSSKITIGRVRDDPDGDGIHLWACCDPLRLSAASAVSLAQYWLEVS